MDICITLHLDSLDGICHISAAIISSVFVDVAYQLIIVVIVELEISN